MSTGQQSVHQPLHLFPAEIETTSVSPHTSQLKIYPSMSSPRRVQPLCHPRGAEARDLDKPYLSDNYQRQQDTLYNNQCSLEFWLSSANLPSVSHSLYRPPNSIHDSQVRTLNVSNHMSNTVAPSPDTSYLPQNYHQEVCERSTGFSRILDCAAPYEGTIPESYLSLSKRGKASDTCLQSMHSSCSSSPSLVPANTTWNSEKSSNVGTYFNTATTSVIPLHQENDAAQMYQPLFDKPELSSIRTATIHKLKLNETLSHFSDPELQHCKYVVTTEICLRARNGDFSADIWYPRAPNVVEIMAKLKRTSHISVSNEYSQIVDSTWSEDALGLRTVGDREPGILCYKPPPVEEFFHPNIHMRPRLQEERLRYPSDLYTPRWIRDEGAKRNGWCSLCEDGQWLQLKTSQYWYHVKGAHGINYHTGQIYDPPVQLRIYNDTCATTHGLCGQCGDWIKIVTPRRKRNFASWFRHAQKCQRSQLPVGIFGVSSILDHRSAGCSQTSSRMHQDNPIRRHGSPMLSPRTVFGSYEDNCS